MQGASSAVHCRARDGMRFMEVAFSKVSRVQKFLKISGFLCEF